MGLLEVGPGVHAELVGEPGARRCVRRERVALAPGEVERGHQPPHQPLVERVQPDQLLQLRDGPRGLAQGDLGVGQVHPGGQPTGLQAGDEPGRGRTLQVGERRAAPQGQSVGQQPGSGRRVTVQDRVVPGRGQPLEVQDVDRVPGDVEEVPPGDRAQDALVGDAQGLAQARHVDLDRVGRTGRWRAVPDGVDQALGGHAGAGGEGEHGQERPRPLATDHRWGAVDERLERTQEAQLQAVLTLPSHAPKVRAGALPAQGSERVQRFVWGVDESSPVTRSRGRSNRPLTGRRCVECVTRTAPRSGPARRSGDPTSTRPYDRLQHAAVSR